MNDFLKSTITIWICFFIFCILNEIFWEVIVKPIGYLFIWIYFELKYPKKFKKRNNITNNRDNKRD